VPIDYPHIFSTTHTVLTPHVRHCYLTGFYLHLHILPTPHTVRQHRVAGKPIFTSPCASRPLFSDGPTTIHTTHYPEALCAGPGTLSLARLIRRNSERIRLQKCRPTVVDVSLHNSMEIVDLRKDTFRRRSSQSSTRVLPSDLFTFCTYLIAFTQLAEHAGSRSTNDPCSIICGFARRPTCNCGFCHDLYQHHPLQHSWRLYQEY
jgi:hypothetical protein